jgi:hypothetical protein
VLTTQILLFLPTCLLFSLLPHKAHMRYRVHVSFTAVAANKNKLANECRPTAVAGKVNIRDWWQCVEMISDNLRLAVTPTLAHTRGSRGRDAEGAALEAMDASTAIAVELGRVALS